MTRDAALPEPVVLVSHHASRRDDECQQQQRERSHHPHAARRDWIEIQSGSPAGAVIDCRGDHRIAMSFSIAGLRVPGVELDGEEADGVERRSDRYRVVTYDTPRGCAAAYYPETNPLVPLGSTAIDSHCPTSKSVIIRLEPHVS